MVTGKPNLLTTGQAAKLCSVTPDTILKWIKKGRLSGVRTAGGHYRIERRALEPLIVSKRPAESPSGQLPECYSRNLHCWEYLSDRGTVRDDCRQCVVYRVRAARCFLMAGLEQNVGHARQFCQGSCEDCVYYRRVQGLATNVLVITSDDELIDRLAGEEDDGITLRVARSGYEASAIIQSFQAAFVVVDQEVLTAGESGLLECLSKDPRLPGVRLVLAVQHGRGGARAHETYEDAVWSVIEKPFGLRQIAVEIVETELLSRRGYHAASRV